MNLEAISILVGSNGDTIGAKLYNGDIVRARKGNLQKKLQRINVESVHIKYKNRYKTRDDRARAAYYAEIKKSVKKEQVITDFI